jgi:hypothetical protein
VKFKDRAAIGGEQRADAGDWLFPVLLSVFAGINAGHILAGQEPSVGPVWLWAAVSVVCVAISAVWARSVSKSR